ncbi:MAG: pyridoxamine 5'-phosphate oxidase, partial [Gordonibacter urolithinfaciens]
YPLGVTDPDYCVLRFTADAGRYYQNFGSEDFVVPEPAGEEPGAPEA